MQCGAVRRDAGVGCCGSERAVARVGMMNYRSYMKRDFHVYIRAVCTSWPVVLCMVNEIYGVLY